MKMNRTICFLIGFLLMLLSAESPVPAQEEKAVHAADQTLASLDQKTQETASREIQEAESEIAGQKAALDNPLESAQNAPVPLAGDTATQANWDAFFSGEKTPDSLIYTIQPGDSLYVIAAKHHTAVGLIKKMNGLKSDTIYAGKKLKIFTGTFSVAVSKSANTLTLFADGKPIKEYRVSTGEKNSTPSGEFKIVNKLANPTWFKTGAIYPPGSPDNALGTRWLGFDLPAYGIHGTIEPEKIGQPVSQGCVRMLNKDVEELDSLIPLGTRVTIND